MTHNVYACIEVAETEDGATWLSTDIENAILVEINPSEITVEVSTIMEGDDADGIPNREAVEFRFTTDLDARRVATRVEDILDRYFPESTQVDVD